MLSVNEWRRNELLRPREKSVRPNCYEGSFGPIVSLPLQCMLVSMEVEGDSKFASSRTAGAPSTQVSKE
jgi:hypothetical protein